jgi:hypothetical protein
VQPHFLPTYGLVLPMFICVAHWATFLIYFSLVGPNQTTLFVWVEPQKLPSWEIYLT